MNRLFCRSRGLAVLDVHLRYAILYIYVEVNHTEMIRNRSTAGARIADLAILGEQVFHADDLANLWKIRKRSTLYETLSRYTKTGLLHRVHKGLYSLKNVTDINPLLLGVKAIHGYAYISCETVLYDAGLINQPSYEITIISTASKRFVVGEHRFRSRKLADRFLYNDIGIEIQDGVRRASTSRAVADMLYFHPKKYFDAPIDVPAVQKIIHTVGYTLSLDSYDDSSKKD